MKRTITRFCWVIAAALLIVSLAGCKSDGAGGKSSETDERIPMMTALPSSGLEPLYSDRMLEMEDAWLGQFGEELDWRGFVYYGTYSDCTVLFLGSMLSVVETLEVAGQKITSDSSFTIWVYHDGEFMKLDEAYDNGLLSAQEIAQIAEYHNNYQNYEHELYS